LKELKAKIYKEELKIETSKETNEHKTKENRVSKEM
jgi:hypothetical protein